MVFLGNTLSVHELRRLRDLWHLPMDPRARSVAPMEPRNRKVNCRRRRAVFLLELACLVGLCGLGYLNVAIALGVLTVATLLQSSATAKRLMRAVSGERNAEISRHRYVG